MGTTDEDVCVCVCINMEKLHMWSLNFISDNNLVLDFFSLQFCPFVCIFKLQIKDSYANIGERP